MKVSNGHNVKAVGVCEGSECQSVSVCVCQYGSYEDCMRGVPAQPLTFEGKQWSKCEGSGCLSMSVCVSVW